MVLGWPFWLAQLLGGGHPMTALALAVQRAGTRGIEL